MQTTYLGGRLRVLAAVAIGSVIAPLAVGAVATAAPPQDTGEKKTYIVQLADDPLAAYDGGTQGIPATKPGRGEKVDVESSAADRYQGFLRGRQRAALAAAGAGAEAKDFEYTVAFNGFSADLTAAQAARIAKAPGVVNVWENEIRTADTTTTPDYLGMTGENGVWETYFEGQENAGSGMVVGVIDTGIWPENPSFADLPGTPAPPPSWNGTCDEGADPDPDANIECNSKVIGARYYADDNVVIGDEFLSPRDYNGHGSHTAGTAAGNFGVEGEIAGNDVGTMSGMAPAAHIAVYKALWQTEDGGGSGSTAGLVKAIDDATRDGVDVINYSISGSREYVVTPDEIAFLYASAAGVFVATSAGNSGDTVGESSVAHNSPWTMTVAASTHDRNVRKTVTLGGSDRVQRISGPNRFETAARISERYPEGVDTVYIATGRDYADALAGTAAASQGLAPGQSPSAQSHDETEHPMPAPVLLVHTDSIPQATASALEDIDPSTIVILGGRSTVSQSVQDELDADYDTVSRVYGSNRYETAAKLARQFGTAERVYVATGEDGAFADALSGAALAGAEGMPVLLTRQGSVPPAVHQVLEDLGDPEVVVLGGRSAVSDAVYTELGAVRRINGSDRYATSAKVAQEFDYDAQAPAPAAYLAKGTNFPDALAGAALAGFQQVPVLLTRPEDLPDPVLTQLQVMDPATIFMLGGPTSVSPAVEAELDAAFPSDEGQTYEGVGVGPAVGPAPLTNAADAARPGVTPQAARECWLDADTTTPGQQPTLDPAVVAGTIVICDRGTVARTDKSAAVEEAGGIGMIQTNTTNAQSLNADYHAVPSIHVNATVGAAVKNYEATAEDPTATISAEGQGGDVVAPEMAGFSSYGPALAAGGDLLKPDITAPGVDVIAAVAPPGNNGENFNSYSGTSMSTPHIAGLAALMAQENPRWSVAAIKSAMMTTASPLNNVGEPIQRSGSDATPLDYGSGEVRPGDAYGPGLVYDAGLLDWILYACSINQMQLITAPSFCGTRAMDPSDLNYPSIAIGDLAGTQTVTRTVTNVSASSETYTAQVQAPLGTTVTVDPAVITVPAGGKATFKVTITRSTAPLDEYTFGSLTWQGSAGHEVRSPIAVQPVGIAAPVELSETGTSGTDTYEVVPGFSGTLNTDVDGLVASQVQNVNVVRNPASTVDGFATFVVPAGTTVLRFATYDEEVDAADIDLVIYNAAGEPIGSSAGGSSEESFTLDDPAAGTYYVAIDLFSAEPSSTVPVHGFFVPATAAGNLTATPATQLVVLGKPVELTLEWSGLTAGSRYLGAVNYLNGTEEVGRTLVNVDATE